MSKRQEALYSVTKPTPEQMSKANLKEVPTEYAGIRTYRRIPPIETLYNREVIDYRQYTAACRWSQDYEIGVLGAKDIDGELPPEVRVDGPYDPHQARLAAVQRYKKAKRLLTIEVGRMAEALIIGGASREHLARQHGIAVKRLQGRIDAALSILADYYNT